jgi:hypothetical protein
MRLFSFKGWIRHWRRRKRYKAIRHVASMSTVPNATGDEIFIVGTPFTLKWAVFDCPCGLGHKLTVNLMKSQWPRWKAAIEEGRLSLRPSLIVDDHPCESHFWLINNTVRWL